MYFFHVIPSPRSDRSHQAVGWQRKGDEGRVGVGFEKVNNQNQNINKDEAQSRTIASNPFVSQRLASNTECLYIEGPLPQPLHSLRAPFDSHAGSRNIQSQKLYLCQSTDTETTPAFPHVDLMVALSVAKLKSTPHLLVSPAPQHPPTHPTKKHHRPRLIPPDNPRDKLRFDQVPDTAPPTTR